MRAAVIGGGISGLAAAYELEKARKAGADVDWQLFEASGRLGGVLQTVREDGFTLEGGPDAWVSEKTAARELAVELGLEAEFLFSQDATRKTYIFKDHRLQAIPSNMRMMVPEDLLALEDSALFSEMAKKAYAAEVERADELKRRAPDNDESVATFVERHFGHEVLTTIAAPLLSGVFGGDVKKLSVRAVMAPFVAMEREYGSLIVGLREKTKARGGKASTPIFTSLRGGMGTLVDAMVCTLPTERIHLDSAVHEISYDVEWNIWLDKSKKVSTDWFDEMLLATPLPVTRRLLLDFDPVGTVLLPGSGSPLSLLPTAASSAVLVAFAWKETFDMPPGFGFLVAEGEPSDLLACTFVDQKFEGRATHGGRVIRTFFGGRTADALMAMSDDAVKAKALAELRRVLGDLPEPVAAHVSKWPQIQPQYEVGHLERIAAFEELLGRIPQLHVLGNCLHGVGVPDLIAQSRACVRAISLK
jgi:oxygen-dependent protoporphyrinogen oxidase